MSPEQIDDDLLDQTRSEGGPAPSGDDASHPAGDQTEPADDENRLLDLTVDVAQPSTCERHVTVTISRQDIDRYYDEAFSELMPTANVPGFRSGGAPRKIVENRFRDEVTDKIKGSLLMDSLAQISEAQDFTAISEPDLDLDAVEVPAEGPMTFEFKIEVRPEFDLPQWKGLQLRRPVRDFSAEDVDSRLEQMLSRYGQLAPFAGPASLGDYVTVNITTSHNGQQLASESEEVLRIRPKLSFVDGELENFAALMEGITAGQKKSATIQLTQDAPNTELRGSAVDVELEVLEVKKLKLPELTEEFLQEIGRFESAAELRDAILSDLERQLEYQQRQVARQQITDLLTRAADWELPPGLLKRQSARELERAVMEMRRSGFSEAELRARENQLRQNSAASTSKALKEHFILERIAEEEDVDIADGDYDAEIALLAMQSSEPPRRVRAQLEKRGLMDVLRNQIIERKVLQLVQNQAKFQDEPYELPQADAEAIEMAAGGGSVADIPDVSKPKPETEESAEASA